MKTSTRTTKRQHLPTSCNDQANRVLPTDQASRIIQLPQEERRGAKRPTAEANPRSDINSEGGSLTTAHPQRFIDPTPEHATPHVSNPMSHASWSRDPKRNGGALAPSCLNEPTTDPARPESYPAFYREVIPIHKLKTNRPPSDEEMRQVILDYYRARCAVNDIKTHAAIDSEQLFDELNTCEVVLLYAGRLLSRYQQTEVTHHED